jgi:hypothetical protein
MFGRKKRARLIEKIMAQYDADDWPEVFPVVSVNEFFDGHWDVSSVAPNIVGHGHPGLAEFRRVLTEIRNQPNVQNVLLAIHSCPYLDQACEADDWPTCDTIYVLTSASEDQLAQWAARLRFNEVGNGWSCNTGIKPPAAPDLQPGERVLVLWWD